MVCFHQGRGQILQQSGVNATEASVSRVPSGSLTCGFYSNPVFTRGSYCGERYNREWRQWVIGLAAFPVTVTNTITGIYFGSQFEGPAQRSGEGMVAALHPQEAQSGGCWCPLASDLFIQAGAPVQGKTTHLEGLALPALLRLQPKSGKTPLTFKEYL